MENKTYFTKKEALQDIIEVLENGYDCYFSELHHEVFNTDYYIIGTYEAEKALEQYGVFNAIREVRQYELDVFGELYTDISNPEKLANMLYYVIGEEVFYDINSHHLIDSMESEYIGDDEREILLTVVKEILENL